MADIEHIAVNGDTYDISDPTARTNASNAQSSADDAAIAASKAQSTADGVKSQINNITLMINEEDQGLDITIS